VRKEEKKPKRRYNIGKLPSLPLKKKDKG